MRRLAPTLALSGALALACATDAGAVVTPPAGTPNLALVVIQPTDLVAGATLASQEYIVPPTGFSAQYGSEYTSASTSDGVNYSLVLDYAAIAPTVATATSFMTTQVAYEQSAKGRRNVIRAIIKGGGKRGHLKPKNIKFTLAQSAGVGDSSFEETITVTRGRRSVQEVDVIFQDGAVCASIELVGQINGQVPETDATTLAAAMVSHINTVIGGATGASGTTGTT